MAIGDYLRKHAQTARRHGIGQAGYDAMCEAILTAAAPIAQERATPIWAADWDVCLVLDACRFDLWQEVAAGYDWLDSDSRWSVGSASPEWLTNTFAAGYDAEIRQTGYVTANPFSAKQGGELNVLDPALFPLADRPFAYLDEVWQDAWNPTGDLPTVEPATLTNRAFGAWQDRREHGIERLVVHYMQPHIPFKTRPEWSGEWKLEDFGTGGHDGKDDWHRVRDGELPADEFWNAYAANLEWVLQEVDRWRQCTDARILVTSDHGNAMGELGQWSHPPESANPVLREVPWVFLDGENTRPIDGVERRPEKETGADIDGRLAALGYR